MTDLSKTPFRLEFGVMPEKKRGGVYAGILEQFLASDDGQSARVVIPGKSCKTVQIGLVKAAQVGGIKTVKVSIIDGDVWLSMK